MAQLGFTFYPKDWWTSDAFFEFDARERYVYLEVLFLMYQNEGYMNLSRENVGARLRMDIPVEVWSKITQKLTQTELGYSHKSVKKRRTKADVARLNGAKGGRPPITQEPRNKPKNNPPYKEKEKEKEKDKKINKKVAVAPPPTKDVFMQYLRDDYFKNKNTEYQKVRGHMIKTYDAWILNNWKDGKDKAIKNWKVKAIMQLRYI